MEQTISGAQQERLIKASETASVEQALEIAGPSPPIEGQME